MASNRLERIGTIYTRVQGLLRSGAMKSSEKPLWYEVYEAFPPAYEPTYGRKAPADVPIRQILYAEDRIRAKYYKKYGSPTTINLNDVKRTIPSQMFIQKYLEMEKDFTDENELFEAVAQILEEERNNKLQNDRPASNIASSFKEVISSKESKSGSNDTDSNSQTIS